jgi:hypothetical protein
MTPEAFGRFQRIARGVLGLGAVGSLGFMFYVGRRQRSVPLVLLFTLWVLSPFAALAWADVMSTQWSAAMRAAVYALMIVVSVGSLLIYGPVAFGPPRPQPASFFLLTPPASWLLMAMAMGVVSVMFRGRS